MGKPTALWKLGYYGNGYLLFLFCAFLPGGALFYFIYEERR